MEGDTVINDTYIVLCDDKMITNETKPNCIWANMMNDDEKSTLVKGLIVIGTLSGTLIAISSLVHLRPMLLGKLRNKRSLYNLFLFISFVYLRTIAALLSRFDSIKEVTTIRFNRCDLVGFFETIFAVLEVEGLTHLCIERYVVAKYITKGWKIVAGHYRMYTFLCLVFGALYSIPPLIGLGRYGCDFGCVACTYEMLLPDTWQRYLISTVFFLRSFKPAAIMVIMLFWAIKLENNFDAVMIKKKADLHFTKCVMTLTYVNLVCWSPIALIRTCVVLSQLLFDEIYIPSSFCIVWAMWIDEATPIFTGMTILFYRCHPSMPMPATDRHQSSKHEIIENDGHDKKLPSKGDLLMKAQ